VPRKRLTRRLNVTVVVIALVVTALDALTKIWVRHALAYHAVHVWSVLWLRLQYNSGVSFSFSTSWPLVTTIVTVLVALLVVIVGLHARAGAATVGFGLLIGGGLANVIDRLAASPHRVTEFIAVSSFPVFNVADIAITFGFIVLMAAALRGDRLVSR
jgi:signal peptidase II